jgi:hypothetical protein
MGEENMSDHEDMGAFKSAMRYYRDGEQHGFWHGVRVTVLILACVVVVGAAKNMAGR